MADILTIVKRRITGDEDVLKDFIQTISDRLCLRLGVEELPALFNTICADAAVKMYRRIYHEGITSESVVNLSTSFVSNVLDEYKEEIEDYKERMANTGGSGKVVRFR